MTTVTISSRGQIVIPKKIRDMLGLSMGNKLKILQENKKIILVAEPEVKSEELFVSASPNAVDKVMKESRKMDDAKLNRLLRDIMVK